MCKKIARVKRNLRLDTRMTQIDVILLFDGITLLQGIAEEKEKCNASASANFVQVLCKHFPLFYIVFSKVIPTFARKTLFYAILARFFTIFWLFSGSFWSWGGRGRTFKSCHSDQKAFEFSAKCTDSRAFSYQKRLFFCGFCTMDWLRLPSVLSAPCFFYEFSTNLFSNLLRIGSETRFKTGAS